MTPDLSFVHRFVRPEAGSPPHTLLLLHGTGGDENDLLWLGESLSPHAALLSPRGKSPERGANRFFRRLSEGVFDQEDLLFRTHELADFVRLALTHYALDPTRLIAVGYSNGANIASSLLLRHPALLAGAILLRPMVPFEPDFRPNLHGKPILVCSGSLDPISPPDQAHHLVRLLESFEAQVTHHVEPAGHQLTQHELSVARSWLTET